MAVENPGLDILRKAWDSLLYSAEEETESMQILQNAAEEDLLQLLYSVSIRSEEEIEAMRDGRTTLEMLYERLRLAMPLAPVSIEATTNADLAEAIALDLKLRGDDYLSIALGHSPPPKNETTEERKQRLNLTYRVALLLAARGVEAPAIELGLLNEPRFQAPE